MAAAGPGGADMTRMGSQRAIRDPKKASGALKKLMAKMPAAQRKQLTSSIGNIFGVDASGLGGQGKIEEAFANLPNQILPDAIGYDQPQLQAGNAIQQAMANAGMTGPGFTPASPSLNPYPGITPPGAPGINPPGTPPSLNLGGTTGTMGMAAPPPTLAQTVNTLPAGNTGGLPAVPGAAGATGAGAAATPAANSPTGENNSPSGTATVNAATNTAGGMGATGASSANTTPLMPQTTPGSGATSNSVINTGALAAPGVGLDVVQNTVNNSSLLNNNPINDQQMFNQQFNPMINMAGTADLTAQFAGNPGRSMVGGAYGEGGLIGTAGQQQANAAALAGGTAAQEAMKTNLQHGLQGQQIQAGMDASGRQQAVQQANAILGPALSGAATGFQAGLGGINRTAQFMG